MHDDKVFGTDKRSEKLCKKKRLAIMDIGVVRDARHEVLSTKKRKARREK